MAEEISAKAMVPNSADLTMTKEYLVIKGKHYQVRNYYLYATEKAQAISIKDILSMEYLTIRSKRLFIIFMILMTLVVLGLKGILIIYAVLIIGSVGCFLLYWLKPFRVLYISTLGKIIAVERKFYDKSQLDCIIEEWKMQL